MLASFALTARVNGRLQSSRVIHADWDDISEVFAGEQARAPQGVILECEECEDYRGQHDDDARQD